MNYVLYIMCFMFYITYCMLYTTYHMYNYRTLHSTYLFFTIQ